MIAILNQKEELVRLVEDIPSGAYGFHRRFGFVSEAAARERQRLAKRLQIGAMDKERRNEWLFRFQILPQGFQAADGCQVEKDGDGRWRLASAHGSYYLVTKPNYKRVAPPSVERESRVGSVVAGLICLLVIAIGVGSALMKPDEETEDEKLAEALAKQKTIVIPEVKVAETPKPAAKVVREKPKTSGAAASNNLGFLKLLGKKELKKAVGGMPTAARETSPGAGAGGTQGSGGEILTGLGQGLKKTTVGNTGVAGLGGIGNAGKGGGQGGFGSAYVSAGGSGGGKVLGEGDLGREVELDGGLDRVVIQATIAKYLSQVRACYEKGLRKNPGLTGQVLMDFEIAATGKLNYSKVRKTSLGNKEVEDCVARVMTSWQFPKPVGGTMVKVSYPFTFKPASYM